MGTHQTRFDAKGRMSVPAQFRAALRAGSPDGSAALVLRPSHQHACIEGWPAPTFAALTARFDQMDVFDEDEDRLTTVLYADACPVEPDKEGRISVPDSLVRHARLSDSVIFLGKGRIFHIWEPEAGLRYLAESRQSAGARRLTLPATRS